MKSIDWWILLFGDELVNKIRAVYWELRLRREHKQFRKEIEQNDAERRELEARMHKLENS